jgi:membrane-bound ClpP family serine protease
MKGTTAMKQTTVPDANAAEPGSTATGEPQRVSTLVDALALPDVAFSLTAVGMLALVCLLAGGHPAFGVVGGVLLTGGVIGLVELPVTAAAALLLALAAASLGMEILGRVGAGLHAVGGGFAMALAGSMLVDVPTWAGAHFAVIMPLSAIVAMAAYLCGHMALARGGGVPWGLDEENRTS